LFVRYHAGAAPARMVCVARGALCQEPNFAGGNAASRHLFHREEGIDLRLPPAATTQVVVEEAATQVSSVWTACCWVDLDENLVLTSVSVSQEAGIDMNRLILRVDFRPRRMGIDDESNQVTEGHLVDALAHTGDEGRGTLR
jgi:hypothetical protein